MDSSLAARAAMFAPDAVLRALASATADAQLWERPVVRVGLSSGQVEEGRLIGVGADRTEEVVVLGSPPHRDRLPDVAVYLRLRDVVSVGVHEAERFRDVLSGGTLPRTADGAPTSRLELRRQYAPSAEFPLQLAWDLLPDSAEATASLAALLATLRDAIREVRADEMGRQAWTRVASVRVEHRPDQYLTMERTPDGLVVSVDLTAALPRRLDGEVGRQLNTVL